MPLSSGRLSSCKILIIENTTLSKQKNGKGILLCSESHASIHHYIMVPLEKQSSDSYIMAFLPITTSKTIRYSLGNLPLKKNSTFFISLSFIICNLLDALTQACLYAGLISSNIIIGKSSYSETSFYGYPLNYLRFP